MFLCNLFVPLSKAAQKSDYVFAPIKFGPFTPTDENAAAEPQPVPVEEEPNQIKEKDAEPISADHVELNA